MTDHLNLTDPARPPRRFVLLGFGPVMLALSLLWRFHRALAIVIAAPICLLLVSFVLPPLLGVVLGTGICWPVITFGLLALAARLTGDHPQPKAYLGRLRAVADANRPVLVRGAVASAAVGAALGVTAFVSDGYPLVSALDVAAGSTFAFVVAITGLLEVASRAPALSRTPTPSPGRTPAAAAAPSRSDLGPRSALNRKQISR